MSKFMKMAVCFALLCAAGFLATSCGHVGGASLGQTVVSLNGTVTDADVSGATINIYSMKTGGILGAATTDASGDYSISLKPDEIASDDVLFAVAEGGAVNGQAVSFLKFKSIVGSVSELRAAGSDGAVTASEMPDLTVSNVTTAKVAIVEAVNNVNIDSGQAHATAMVTEIVDCQEEQERNNLGVVIKLAAAIKAVVDDPSDPLVASLGLGADSNIHDYIKSAVDTSTDGVIQTNLDAGLEAAGNDLEDEILGSSELMQSAVGTAATTAVGSSDIAGNWYGYHTDTWGEAGYMQGPELVNITASAGGSCASGEISIQVEGDASPVCATLSGNIIKFVLPGGTGSQGTETIECVGTITGSVLNGNYTMKINGASKAGGIFKLGKSSSADSFGGSYSFTGSHMLKYINATASGYSDKVGSSSTLSGSITIAGSAVTGSITEQNASGADSLQGELTGPRVTARIAASESTIFIVFLLNESDVTGLYMEFSGQLSEPGRDPLAAGTFNFSTMTKN